MPTKTTSITPSRGAAMFATMALPIEPFSVRILVAVQLTGIGRSKLYELIAAGELVTVASLRSLIQKRRRA
jgi:hypothetical protein